MSVVDKTPVRIMRSLRCSAYKMPVTIGPAYSFIASCNGR